MRVSPGASLAFGGVPLHLDELYAGKRIIYEGDVLLLKLSAVHGGGLGLG
jgi:hypothetical protein